MTKYTMETSSKKRKICVFLGSRANYSSLKPIMTEIKKDPELDLVLFAGAAALLDKYGEVVELVKKDGFRIDEYIYMLVEGANPVTMAKSTGLGLGEIPNMLYKYARRYNEGILHGTKLFLEKRFSS